MKHKGKILVGSAFTFTLTGIMFVGNYFYSESIKRGSIVELHREKSLINTDKTENESVLKEAKKLYQNINPDRVTMASYDDLILKADYIENNNKSDKAVILMHGFRKQRVDMGNYVKYYLDRGFNILMPDARGHGESEGNYYGYGWHDRLDMLKWIDYLVNKETMNHIILHGNSAGAATVLMTSGEKLTKQVKGIIADSGFTSMNDELKHQLKNLYGIPSFPLLKLTSVITKIRAGYYFSEVTALEQVKKNKLPLFIIHGDADELVPTEMSKLIYKAANVDNKRLWIVPETGHIKAYETETIEFEKRLDDFLTTLF